MAINDSVGKILAEAAQQAAGFRVDAVLQEAAAAAGLLDNSTAIAQRASEQLAEGTKKTLPFLPELQAAEQVAGGTNQSLAEVAQQARAAELHSLGMFATKAATSPNMDTDRSFVNS